jgi:hypothetical protein
VILDVNKLSFLVHPLERVASITVVVTPSLRSTMVTEKHHACMIGFRSERKKVKEGVVVKQEVLWVAGLRANDIWALDRVSAEEDRLVDVRESNHCDNRACLQS